MIKVNGNGAAAAFYRGANVLSLYFRGAKVWEHNHSWIGGTCKLCYEECNHPSVDSNGICTTCGQEQGTSVVFYAKRDNMEEIYDASDLTTNIAYIQIPDLPLGLYLSKQYAKRSTTYQWKSYDPVVLDPISPGKYYLYYFTYSNGNKAPYLMTLTQNGSKIIERSAIMMNDVESCYPVEVTIPAGRRTTFLCDFETIESL